MSYESHKDKGGHIWCQLANKCHHTLATNNQCQGTLHRTED